MADGNVVPVAVPDTAAVSEDAVLSATGNVLTNDSDAEGNPLTVIAVNGVAANVGATIVGTYGTLTLGANGAYTYALNNAQANVQALTAGQVVNEVFNYTLSDGQTHTTTTNVAARNAITQSEAFGASPWIKLGSATVTSNVAVGPTAAGATGTTADQIVLAGQNKGIYFETAVSGQYTFSIWVKLVSGTGTFDLNYWNGSSASTLKPFTATTTWQQFTVTFTGSGNASANVAFMHYLETTTGTFQIWGAQLNPGAAPDPYVATTGTAISTTVPVTTTAPLPTTTLTVSVTGAAEPVVNVAPVANADAAAVSEDNVVNASGNVLTNDTDGNGDVLTVTSVKSVAGNVGVAVVGTYGALTLNANGTYSYALANGQANVQALAAGQTVTDVFAYAISDGKGGTATANLTVTVTGAAEPAPPVANADAAAVSEDNVVNASGNVLTNDTDANGDTLTVTSVKGVAGNVGASVVGTYGALVLNANGTYTYVLANGQANVQALATGQTVTDVFAYAISDGNGGTSTANLTVTITGADEPVVNVAPVANTDAAAASEDDVLSASGNVLTNDTDANGDALTVTSVKGVAGNVGASVVGTYGTLVLNANGTYSYALANAQANVQALTAGQTVTDVFAYAISDGKGGTATANLTVTITGAAEPNTAPVAVADAAAVSEDNVLSASGNVLTNDTDANGDALTVASVKGVAGNVGVAVVGTYGSLTLNANGTYSYALANGQANVQALAAGQTVTDVFAYAIADGKGGTATANLTVTVTGANEAGSGSNVVPVATADTGAVSEDNILNSVGNVLTNDSDAEGNPLTVVAVNGVAANVGATIVGTYGTLTLGANGAYTYALNNAQANVQALTAGQVVNEVFNYTLSDGQTHTTTTNVAARNAITQSEGFSTATWIKFGSATVTANTAAGPTEAGATGTTADQIVLAGQNRGIYFETAVSGQYTFSVWVKLVSGTGTFDLNYWNGSSASTLKAFTATTSWQQFTVTFTGSGNASANVAFMHYLETTTGTFQLWGAQLNPGATPDPYVATTGTAVSTTVPVSTTAPLPTTTLTIAITGADEGPVNVAPVANADAAAVSEDNVVSASGNVLTNDTDANGDALTVTSVKGVAGNVGAAVVGTYGTLTLNANGTYSYALANAQANVQALTAGQTVTDVFAYAISDGKGGTATANLTVTVTGAAEPNTAPVAVADAAAVSEDNILSASGNVLTNDTDANGDALTVASVKGVAGNVGVSVVGTYGSLVLNTNGSYSYYLANTQANVQALAAGQTVTDVFAYAISDGKGGTATANLTVTVTGAAEANINPTAIADVAIPVAEDGPYTATGNVLANDSDGDGDTLSVVSVGGSAANVGATLVGTYGSIVLGANGAYNYVLAATQANVQALAAGQIVTETFTYVAGDGKGGLATSTLSIDIYGRGEVVAVADTGSVSEDGTLHATGNLLTNDTDPYNGALTTTPGPNAVIVGVYGTLYIGYDGLYTYVLANAQANVQALAAGQIVTDVFSYAAVGTFGNSATSTLTITITGAAENGDPVAVGDVAQVSEDNVLNASGNVLTNDSDPNGDALTVTSVKGVAGNVGAAVVGTYGTLTLNANGTYSYALANAQANVQALTAGQTVTDVFAYAISDGKGGTATANLTVTVTGAAEPNTAPVAVADSASVSEDNVLSASGNVLTNDTDANGDALTVASVKGVAGNVGAAVVGTYGTLTLNANGTYSYALANGQANVQALTAGQTVTDVFAYAISDGKGGTATANLTVTVTGAAEANAAPTAVGDVATVSEDHVITASGSVLTNDSDPDGDALTVTSVKGLAGNVGVAVVGTYGTLTLSANGSYSYALANGQANVQALDAGATVSDVFSYAISDGKGGVATASLTITVTGTPEATVAVADSLSLTEDGIVGGGGNLTANDIFDPMYTTSIVSVNGVAASNGVTFNGTYGVLVVNANGLFSYTLANNNWTVQSLTAGQVVTEVFSYTMSDGHGGTASSSLTVSIAGASDRIIAVADAGSVSEDGVLTASGNLIGNDTGNAFTPLISIINGVSIVASGTVITGTYGKLVINPDGSYTYSIANSQANVQALAAGQVVNDVFNYTLSDGYGETATSTLTIAVTGADEQNELPSAQADAGAVAEDGVLSATGNVLTNDTDEEGNPLTVITVNGVAANVGATIVGTYGSLVLGANGAYSYVLNNNAAAVQNLSAGQVVTEQFAYTITDGQSHPPNAVAGSTLTITITGAAEPGPNESPVAISNVANVAEDGLLTATGNVLANDSDSDGDPLTVVKINGVAANVGATIVGTYGTLTLGANGAYSYALNNAQPNVQALVGGQTAQDVFTYTISDGQTHSSTVNVPARNAITQSEAFGSSPWVKLGSATVTSNVAGGPTAAGATGTTADQIVLAGQNKGIYFETAVSGQYTFSIWVKLVSGTGTFDLNFWNGSNGSTLKPFTATTEWQQFSVTFNALGNASANVAFMHYLETTTGTFQIWGAQLNPGAAPDPYVATTGSAVSTTVPVTTTEPMVSSTLTINIAGANETGNTSLTFAGSNQGTVVNLATGQWDQATKVLALGDSITYGANPADSAAGTKLNIGNGYRGPLWQTFANSSALIDFVGPRSAGSGYLADHDHAGYSGYRVDQIATEFANMKASLVAGGNVPDTVLLMAGTNDIFQNSNPVASVNEDLPDLIQAIAALNPAAHIYVATLLPINYESYGAKVPSVNSAITTIVNQLAATGVKVHLVSMASMTTADLFDGTHPSDAGYAKMAQIWYSAIQAYQPTSGGTIAGTPSPIDPSVTAVTGSGANDLLIADSRAVTFDGGAGNDRLVAGAGNSFFTGGAGEDQFELSPTSGRITVTDFATGHVDHIVLDGFTGLTQFSNLSGHISQISGGTQIDLAGFGTSHASIFLTGFTGTLTADDFFFT